MSNLTAIKKHMAIMAIT